MIEYNAFQKEVFASGEDKNKLLEMSNDRLCTIRGEVALNCYTPKEILLTLAKDEERYVRQNVAENCTTPGDILDLLSYDKSMFVRAKVASNNNTEASTLYRLSKDETRLVKHNVSRNMNCKTSTLLAMLEENDKIIKNNVNETLDLIAKYEMIDRDSDIEKHEKYIENTTTFDREEFALKRLHDKIPLINMRNGNPNSWKRAEELSQEEIKTAIENVTANTTLSMEACVFADDVADDDISYLNHYAAYICGFVIG